MAMAFQIIASSSSSSLTITKSHFHSYPPLQSCYKASKSNLSSWFSLMGSSRFSPYIGLKHLSISISPKSSNPERKRRCKGMMIRASLFGVGAPEALVIGVVALLVFGPKGLAEVARNLGKTLRTFQPTIRELQDVSRDFKSTLEREIGLDDINVYNQNRMNNMNNVQAPPPPPPSVPSTEDPGTANDPNNAQSPKAYTTEDYLKITEEQLKASSPGESRADDAQSPKAYSTEDYLKITEEQLKASSPGEIQTEDQTQTQEPLQPTTVQTPTGESQPNGTARETTASAPPRQD